MARLSEAEARRLGILGTAKKPAGTSSREKPDATRRGGRNRAARIPYHDESVNFFVELPFDPKPKERPRTVTDMRSLESAFLRAKGSLAAFREFVGKGASRTFTPKNTKDYEDLVSYAARAAMRSRAPMTCPVDVEIEFTFAGPEDLWPTSAADGDGDNLEKAVLDAMNDIVFKDDRQVVRSTRIKRCGAHPSLRIKVGPAAP